MEIQTEVKFEVVWQAKLLDKISDVMSRMDLGIDHIEWPQTSIYSWKTSKKIDKEYVLKSKEAIKLGLEATERRMISIKTV